MALNIMLQGTMSNAGKSLLSAGLCRIFRQDGYHVAPFKSQNMALNSFITKDSGEMGRAQVVQAEACGLEPDVRMNPILLKPTTDVGSQVIVNGQVRGNMRAMEYYAKKREFLPDVMRAYESLAAENDVIVIEGAGSPAEINLNDDNVVLRRKRFVCSHHVRQKFALFRIILHRAHVAAHLAVDDDLTANVGGRFQKDRVHAHIGL